MTEKKQNVLISHMVVFMFEENHLLTSRVSSRCHLLDFGADLGFNFCGLHCCLLRSLAVVVVV